MNNEFARHIAITAFRSCAELDNLIPLLKEHCSQDEYDKYMKIITGISTEIYAELLRGIYEEYPDIKADVDRRVSTYGKLISC